MPISPIGNPTEHHHDGRLFSDPENWRPGHHKIESRPTDQGQVESGNSGYRYSSRAHRSAEGDLPHLPRAAHVSGTWHTGPDPRRSMLFSCVGVGFAIVLGTFVSAYIGALALAATMIGAGIWRAWAPVATRAAGIAVRSKWFDVVFYWILGITIAVLTISYPEALVSRWS